MDAAERRRRITDFWRRALAAPLTAAPPRHLADLGEIERAEVWSGDDIEACGREDVAAVASGRGRDAPALQPLERLEARGLHDAVRVVAYRGVREPRREVRDVGRAVLEAAREERDGREAFGECGIVHGVTLAITLKPVH